MSSISVKELHNQLVALKDRLKIEDLKNEISLLEKQTEDPNFWNEQQKAGEFSQKFASLKEEVANPGK